MSEEIHTRHHSKNKYKASTTVNMTQVKKCHIPRTSEVPSPIFLVIVSLLLFFFILVLALMQVCC